MKIDAIMIKPVDNVATALRDIEPGEELVVGMGDKRRQVSVQETIPHGRPIQCPYSKRVRILTAQIKTFSNRGGNYEKGMGGFCCCSFCCSFIGVRC